MKAVMEVIRHKNEAAWIKFEQERPTIMNVEDIPWPAGPKGDANAAHTRTPVSEFFQSKSMNEGNLFPIE